MTGLFVTGTDTGVGKTWTACTVLHSLRESGHRVGAYKPVCSGAESAADGRLIWSDAELLRAAAGGEWPLDCVCPQRFAAALSPPAAAAEEGTTVDWNQALQGVDWWQERVDCLVVEGAGGLLCPLTDDRTIADLAAELRFPMLIVAADRLGTINHTLLTLEVARSRRLAVAGVVLCRTQPTCDDSAATNAEWISRLSPLTEVSVLNWGERRILSRGRALSGVDWMERASR